MIIDEIKQADPAFLEHMHRILYGDHWDPHQFLGLHPFFKNKKIIRIFRPGAQEIYIKVKGLIHIPRKIHQGGIFDLIVDGDVTYKDYSLYHQNGLEGQDPYSMQPLWGELDSYLLSQGTHYDVHKKLGAHVCVHQGLQGVYFAVWAPSAIRVSVVGDFNHWDGRVNPMRSMGACGVFELFVPGLTANERYKFEIKDQNATLHIKTDPYAYFFEKRPNTACIVASVDTFKWTDEAWMQRPYNPDRPLHIYEVHLGSWRALDNLNYRQLAVELALYCQQMGYTHVELLPIMEHPLDESWGYQVTGYFAVTSRYGQVEDFQWFVNHLHEAGVGVLLDWVPGHFPTDSHALARFDGTALYEHADPRQGFHPHWNTLIFNYGRKEVSNFLIASALFWLEVMHVDGLRVDAVASMLYLDYGRQEGEWIPNCYGGKENLEALEFLKHLNSIIHQRVPRALMIAEESTSFAGITRPLEFSGLGFDLKWNMGWMNDTLRYVGKDPLFRVHHHQDLTFGLLYAFSEQFLLPFSHDEVVHGKGSMLAKMPGDYWQKFANLRLLLAYQICQPGKKLTFMGSEIGQWNEWDVKNYLDFSLLQFPQHAGLRAYVAALNHFYLQHEALWRYDFNYCGFEWVDFSDQMNSVVAYMRKGQDQQLLIIHNFTPAYHDHYVLKLKNCLDVQEVFNSDASVFGGSGKTQLRLEINPENLIISIPPLATVIYKIAFYSYQ